MTKGLTMTNGKQDDCAEISHPFYRLEESLEFPFHRFPPYAWNYEKEMKKEKLLADYFVNLKQWAAEPTLQKHQAEWEKALMCRSKYDFSLTTWNVATWRFLPSDLTSAQFARFFIGSLPTTVLCFQEFPQTMGSIPLGSIAFAFGDYKYQTECIPKAHSMIPFGNRTYSQWPFLYSEDVTMKPGKEGVEPRCFMPTVIPKPWKKENVPWVRVINTHLDVYDSTAAERKREIVAILDYYHQAQSKQSMPTIIVGDFNPTRKEHTYTSHVWSNLTQQKPTILRDSITNGFWEQLDDANFVSAFEAIYGLNPGFTVWSGKTVDWIMLDGLARSEFSMIKSSATIFPVPYSDHLPLACILKSIKH
jgi:endonuclease/exonuclease/phosphatase family metal-dependent hydrolase